MNIVIDDNAKNYIKKKGGNVKITFKTFHSCGS